MAEAVQVLDRKPVRQRPPGPRFRTPFGFLAAMRRDPLGLLTECARRYGDEEDEVSGWRIPRGASVTVSPYITHRHPAFWEHPEDFDPERISPERSAGRPEYAYFPFGGGPRGCIGKQFAMMEGQLVLAMLAQQFSLQGVAGHRVEPHPILTLRPRDGLPMLLHPRA